jgi:hypothetical protein
VTSEGKSTKHEQKKDNKQNTCETNDDDDYYDIIIIIIIIIKIIIISMQERSRWFMIVAPLHIFPYHIKDDELEWGMWKVLRLKKCVRGFGGET